MENKGPYKFIPLKAGLRYYIKYFYLQGEAGESFKANVTANSFIYGGALGGLIPFNRPILSIWVLGTNAAIN